MPERVKKRNEVSLGTLRTGKSLGALFFRNNDLYTSILGSILSIVIFSYWTFRLFQGELPAIVLSGFYVFSVLLAMPFWNRLSIHTSQTGVVIEYRKSGLSWTTLAEAQVGGFLIFVAMYWLISNSLADNQGILLLINSVAILCATYIIPFLPLLSKFPLLNILKTTLVYSQSDGLDLQIHPLDSRWQGVDYPELVVSLTTQLQNLIGSLEMKG